MKKTFCRWFILFPFLLLMPAHAGDVPSLLMARTRHPRMAFTLDISPKAGGGNTFFLNSNVKNDPNAKRYFFCPSYFYGGRAGLTFISSFPNRVFFTLYGEYLFSNFSQKYLMTDYSSHTTYDHEYNVGGISKALVFRTTIFSGYENGGAMYLEVGTQTSTLKKATEKNSANYVDFYTQTPNYRPLSKFNAANNNLIVGLGAHGIVYSIGLRFTYGRAQLMANNVQPVDDGHYNNTVSNPGYLTHYADKKETRLLMVELVFELNLYLLELGNATCGKQRLFPFPMHLNQDVIW